MNPLEPSVIEIESDEDDAELATGPRASWMGTPTGSPQVVPLEVNNPAAPAPPPPAYYTLPLGANSFGFPLAVVDFLQAIDAGPRALCQISSARDYDVDSWVGQFRAVGLSIQESKTLQELFVASLTLEQRMILNVMVPSSPTTSISTESSLTYSIV